MTKLLLTSSLGAAYLILMQRPPSKRPKLRALYRSTFPTLLSGIAAVSAGMQNVHAATVIKLDSASISQTSADWSATPATTDLGQLDGTINTANAAALNLTSDVTLEGLIFTGTLNGPVVIGSTGGNKLTLGASGIDATAANRNVTINHAVELGAAQTWRVGTSASSTSVLNVSGPISGNFGLTLTNNVGAYAQNIVFSGTAANTYTGLTTLSAGSLYLQKTAGVNAIAGNISASGSGSNITLGANHQIADTSTVTLANAAKLILNGFNETIGGLNSTGSTSLVQAAETAGSANSTLTINTATGTSYNFNGSLLRDGSGAGNKLSLVKSGDGIQILQGSLVHTGTTTISAGTLVIRATGNTFYSTKSIDGWKSVLTNNAILELEHTNATVVAETLTAAISGTGNLVKSGAGTIILSQAGNTYSGDTNVNAGVLAATGGNAIGDSSNVVLANVAGATFQLNANETIGALSGGTVTNGTVALQANVLTVGAKNVDTSYAGKITGTGGVTKTGTGKQTFAGVNTYTGDTTINQGILTVEGGSAIADNAKVVLANTSGATFQLNANETIGAIEGGGTTGGEVDLQSRTLTVGGGNVSGSFAGLIKSDTSSDDIDLIKSGTGTQFLTNEASTYTGVTVLGGGILNVAKIGNYGENSSLGNRLSAADHGQTAGPPVVASSVGLLFRGGTLQYTGSTAQTTNRQIRIAGSMTPGAAGTGGTIDASGSNVDATLSFTASSSVDIFENQGFRTLTLTGSNQGNNTFNISLVNQASNATSLTKEGTGTWRLTGTHSYSGNTQVNDGKFLVNGTISNSSVIVSTVASLGGTGTMNAAVSIQGTLSPGSDAKAANNGIGTLSFGNNLTFADNSSFFVGIGSAGSSDRVKFTAGNLILGNGVLLNGTFAGLQSDITNNSRYWLGELSATSSITGTFANSQAFDWTGLLTGYNHATDNGFKVNIGGQDFALFYGANFGSSSGYSGGNDILLVAVIPEPGRILLLALGSALLLFRRRR